MKIQIGKDWFNKNVRSEEGYNFDETNEIYIKTITEDELNLEFSKNGEFRNISVI